MSIKDTIDQISENNAVIKVKTICAVCTNVVVCFRCETLSCKTLVCKECYKKYILTIPIPICMGCGIRLTRYRLVQYFGKKYVDTDEDFVKHREELSFNIEKSLFPDTIQYVELVNKIAEDEKSIQLYHVSCDVLYQRFKIWNMEPWVDSEIREKVTNYRRAIEYRDKIHVSECDKKYYDTLVEYWRDYINYQSQSVAPIRDNSHDKHIIHCIRTNKPLPTHQYQRAKFVKKCTNADCNGYLSTRWKCSTCNVYTCSKCQLIHEGECKQEDLDSIKLIESDSRPCPGCQTLIFKIMGCDQMWCTQCNKGFSWNTGEIIDHMRGFFHNPHFIEYRNRQNTETLDRQCADFIPPKKYEDLYTIAHGLLIDYRVYHNGTLDLRLDYLLNKSTEEYYKSSVLKRLKLIERNQDFIGVCNVFIELLIDRLNVYNTQPELREVVDSDVLALINMYNTMIDRVGKCYNTSVYNCIIYEDGIFKSVRKSKTKSPI